MTTILPSARSSWDVIGEQMGHGLSQTLPQAAAQRSQRETGMNAIDQLQQQLQQSGGDMSKMLPALARAYTLNPNLERSQLGQFALQNAKVQNAYGVPQGQNQGQLGQSPQISQNQEMQQSSMNAKSDFVTPSPFNIMTPQDMDAEARRFAAAVNDPNGYNTRLNQLQNQNENATSQRQALEDSALKAHVPPSELPRFMVVNSHLNPSNPSEWAQEAKRNYAKVKANDDKLERAFIPGIGNALLGQNRDRALKDLIPTVQDQVKRGLEQETRNFLTDQYLSPTEVESLIHPITPKTEKAIESLPRGLFPAEKKASWSDVGEVFKGKLPNSKTNPFISYEEALEKDPKSIQLMQDKLSDFFKNTVNDDTSLLVLRDKLWNDKDYDWRQIGPAIRQAEKMGLKLNTAQSSEMADIESQPPIQSLPDIFKDWGRFKSVMRGNK